MNVLDTFLARVTGGEQLTKLETLRLLAVAAIAAQFTEANDRGDDASSSYDDAEDDAQAEAASAASNQADDDYNRSKAELFSVTRELMGWPARASAYPPPAPEPGPHPFEQEP